MKKIFILLFAISTLANAQCDIEKDVDKFDGKITFKSPVKYYCRFIKTIKGADTAIYLRLRTSGATINFGEVGATILLSDGSRIERPQEKVKAELATGAEIGPYVYSVFLELDEEEIRQLSKAKITDFKLYIYDGHVRNSHQEKFQNYLKCILAAK